MRTGWTQGLTFLALLWSAGWFPAQAEAPKWAPHIEISGQFSSARVLGEADLFMPLMQGNKSLLFVDLRGVLDDDGAREGNFGLGFRTIIGDSLLLGGYVFYDRRISLFDNKFDQVTVGLEAKTERFDARFNYYLPEKGKKGTDISAGSEPFLSGNMIWLPGVQAEQALEGFDGEVGLAIPGIKGLTVYGGGYSFQGGTAPDVRGPRGRMEWRFDDFLPGSPYPLNLTLTAEITDDNWRGTRGWGGLRLRVPFGRAARVRHSRLKGLEMRMTDRIQRDVDVVTVLAGTVPLSLLSAGQNIWFVDNTAGAGDGGFENPFATLQQAEAAAGTDDIIYIYAGDGTSLGYDQGFVMQSGQSLIGEGVGLTWDGYSLLAAGQMPLLSNLADNGAIVQLASSGTVRGLHIDGGGLSQWGLYGLDVGGVLTVSDNRISGTTSDAVYVESTGQQGSLMIANNEIFNSSGMIRIRSDDGELDVAVLDNNFHDNLWGMSVVIGGGGQQSVDIIGNSFTDNRTAIYFSSGDTTHDVNISDNILLRSGEIALWVFSDVQGTILIEGNSVSSPRVVDLFTRNARILVVGGADTLTIRNNLVDGGGIGIQYATGTINIEQNSVTNSPYGLSIMDFGRPVADGTAVVSLSDNRIENVDVGLEIWLSLDADLAIMAQRNSISSTGLAVRVTEFDGFGIGDLPVARSLEIDFGDGALGSVGQNSFLSGSEPSVWIDLPNNPDVLISAGSNWWGQAGGPTAGQIDDVNAQVDTSNALDAPPQ